LRRQQLSVRVRAVELLQLANFLTAQSFLGAKLKGLTMDVDVPADAVVESDPDLIVLVLQNLVGNSIKYSERGCIRVAARRDTGDRWTLFVSDEGPGIPPQQLDRIFNSFERADVDTQRGLGLGLAIACEAARLLGAELSVRSQLGVGSTFGLTLNGTAARVGANKSGNHPGIEQYAREKGESQPIVKRSESWHCQ